MKARNDCEIACDCVMIKRANVVLHVGQCKEIFARKHTATHKPTSAQPPPPHSDLDDTHTPHRTHTHRDTHTHTHIHTHTPINRLWSPLAYGLGAIVACGAPWPTALGAIKFFLVRMGRDSIASHVKFVQKVRESADPELVTFAVHAH